MGRFNLDGLEVFFPYDYVYPEQYAYMRQLKASLDAKGHAVLEMPTGTGKTVAIFSLVTSYQLAHPEVEKFYFCTRTVAEMEKALLELRGVLRYRQKELVADNDTERLPRAGCLATALSARRNLCVHPKVSRETDRDKIDEACRKLTAPWVRRQYETATDISGAGDGTVGDIEELDCESPDCKLCPWYEEMDRHWNPQMLPPDVYTVDEFRRFGQTGRNPVSLSQTSNPDMLRAAANIEAHATGSVEGRAEAAALAAVAAAGTGTGRKFCPYFAARRVANVANILILNYQYVLDPRVAQIAFQGSSNLFSASGQLFANAGGGGTSGGAIGAGGAVDTVAVKEPNVIVFDEAHNIDNVCIEALSINLTVYDLERARHNINKLNRMIGRARKKGERRLLEEYERLLRSVYQESGGGGGGGEGGGVGVTYESFLEEHMGSPLLPEDQKLLQQVMPGTIRKAELFVAILTKMVQHLDQYVRQFTVVSEGPLTFLRNLEEKTQVEAASMKFFYERLKSLFVALQVTELQEFMPISKVADFCTLIGHYWKGFIIITDPYPEAPGIYDPVIQLSCLDSSLAMKPVLERFRSVVLTSGTISPLHLYPRLLGFNPVITQSFQMSLDRRCICPMVVAKGPDQIPLSSKYELREDVAVIRNYGRLLTDFARTVPDGLVCFFTSYAYMEIVVNNWYSTGVLAQVMRHKLIMMETKDIVSTTLALNNYRKCCDSGRGAVFFSVARGKVAEGIDFDRHYGRAVILFGVPFQYTLSRVLKARLEYMRENYAVAENEFLSFDAMRQAAQCVGRIIRSKADYGLMVFADYRYGKPDKKSKMPDWILNCMDPHHSAVTVDVAVEVAKQFLTEMSLPYQMTMKSRLDQKTLTRLTQIVQRSRIPPTNGLEVPQGSALAPTPGGPPGAPSSVPLSGETQSGETQSGETQSGETQSGVSSGVPRSGPLSSPTDGPSLGQGS